MKAIVRDVYYAVNSRTLYAGLVGFCVVLLTCLLPR